MCPVTLLFMGGGIVGGDVVRGVSEGGGVGEAIYIGLYDGDLEGWLVVVVVEVVGLSVVGCNDDDIGEFDGDEDDAGSGVIGDLDGSDVGDLVGNIVDGEDDGERVVGGGEGGGVVGWGPIG